MPERPAAAPVSDTSMAASAVAQPDWALHTAGLDVAWRRWRHLQDDASTERLPWPAEPVPSFWLEETTYDALPAQAFVEPLALAAARGAVPGWLQDEILGYLHWYFTVDGRARAPTVRTQGAQAEAFLAHATQALRYISPERLDTLEPASAEVRHAMLACRGAQGVAGAALHAVDDGQELVLVRYWVHGRWPEERFVMDGHTIAPRFAKWRACRYYGRTLLHERIAWLSLRAGQQLNLWLDGRATPVGLGPQPFARPGIAMQEPTQPGSEEPLLDRARKMLGLRGVRAPLPLVNRARMALVQSLATLPAVRRRFRDAWVFIDREGDADDNAEHLYRWVRQHHPEVNAWFLLRRDSRHWQRLAAEGFRLMAPSVSRRLLLHHAAHVISSHVELVDDASGQGAHPRRRFTFVPHGISKDDVSHWLNAFAIDRFITSCPDEHASIVRDGSAYVFTEQTARMTGLPRRDRLWQMARSTPVDQVRLLLLMPTWRASLVDGRAGATGDPAARLQSSAFWQAWSSLLRQPALSALADRAGLRVALMAHANLVPLLDGSDLPSWIELYRAGHDQFQPLLCQTAALVTDYSSVAFEMAFLRRAVFYYQPDRAAFYAGDHNWRPGYFDYDRDGFGPVALDAESLIGQLESFVARGMRPDEVHLDRMQRSHPVPDDQACRRVFDSIRSLERSG